LSPWASEWIKDVVVKIGVGVVVFVGGRFFWQLWEKRRHRREAAQRREDRIDAAVASVGRIEKAIPILAERERVAHNLTRRLAFAAMQEPPDRDEMRKILNEMHELREGSYRADYYKARRLSKLPLKKGPVGNVDLQTVLSEMEESQ
jgi:hypothetical protein